MLSLIEEAATFYEGFICVQEEKRQALMLLQMDQLKRILEQEQPLRLRASALERRCRAALMPFGLSAKGLIAAVEQLDFANSEDQVRAQEACANLRVVLMRFRSLAEENAAAAEKYMACFTARFGELLSAPETTFGVDL
ncbi:MAG: flagellar export chaperone FlgN [Oscillospiraceae bacterium]|nr:flagellar export chaperone FlgN [Oscillospiraceae bacterium]